MTLFYLWIRLITIIHNKTAAGYIKEKEYEIMKIYSEFLKMYDEEMSIDA